MAPLKLEVLQKALDCWSGGQVVLFPTDTSYVATIPASSAPHFASLFGERGPPAVIVTGPEMALEWIPDMSVIGQRLIRRCWPGPVTLAFPFPKENSPALAWPETIKDVLSPDGRLHLRFPAHEALFQAVYTSPEPIVCIPVLGPDGNEITRPEDVPENLPAALVIADGNTYFGKSTTNLFVNQDHYEILQTGVVSAEEVHRLTLCQIVFVCTGNTCRSPLAEVLCKKLLSEKLGCRIEELPTKGFQVFSAGLVATEGAQASPEAVEVAQEMGVDLSPHQSRPLNAELFFSADYILTMTNSHLQALAGLDRGGASPAELLSPEGQDISDPIGQEKEVYQQCAQQIWHNLNQRLADFLLQ